MKIIVPLAHGITLQIGDRDKDDDAYATSHLQKGFLLFCNGELLSEEAVGFGVPVLKCGLRTIFPGAVRLSSQQNQSIWEIRAEYTLNLEERITGRGKNVIRHGLLYSMKNVLAAIIRQVTPLRKSLTAASSMIRRLFRLETKYEDAGFHATIPMSFTIDTETGIIKVTIEIAGIEGKGVTEIIVMNEQGAHYFNRYQDSSGLSLHNDKIGCWDQVAAEKATFESTTHHVSFILSRAAGANLFRGRELVDSRLAWAGFGYSFAPTMARFMYEMKIERLS